MGTLRHIDADWNERRFHPDEATAFRKRQCVVCHHALVVRDGPHDTNLVLHQTVENALRDYCHINTADLYDAETAQCRISWGCPRPADVPTLYSIRLFHRRGLWQEKSF